MNKSVFATKRPDLAILASCFRSRCDASTASETKQVACWDKTNRFLSLLVGHATATKPQQQWALRSLGWGSGQSGLARDTEHRCCGKKRASRLKELPLLVHAKATRLACFSTVSAAGLAPASLAFFFFLSFFVRALVMSQLHWLHWSHWSHCQGVTTSDAMQAALSHSGCIGVGPVSRELRAFTGQQDSWQVRQPRHTKPKARQHEQHNALSRSLLQLLPAPLHSAPSLL